MWRDGCWGHPHLWRDRCWDHLHLWRDRCWGHPRLWRDRCWGLLHFCRDRCWGHPHLWMRIYCRTPPSTTDTLSGCLAFQRSRDRIPLTTLLIYSVQCLGGAMLKRVGSNGQSMGSIVSDAIVCSLLWSTASESCPFGYFSNITASSR